MTKIKQWHPDHFARKIPFLQERARIIRNIRQFFDQRGYMEVETPALQVSPGMEPHIKAFETSYTTPDHAQSQRLFLHTSPEFAMKKLLVGGCTQIYQICKTFRNAEDSPHHSPEFTMMEWYHTGMDYTDLMQECIALLRAIHDQPYRFQGLRSDAHQEWQIISVCESFQIYAGIDLEDCLPETEDALDKLKAAAAEFYHEGDSWEDLFVSRLSGQFTSEGNYFFTNNRLISFNFINASIGVNVSIFVAKISSLIFSNKGSSN
jgi:lysyl-tRNA synthetase class 2